MKYKSVIFDMDGLMFNSEDIYYAASEETLKSYGKKYTQQLHRLIMGTTVRKSMEMIIQELNLPVSWETLGAQTHEHFVRLLPSMLKPMPGLFELLDFLDANSIPRAIATSTNRILMEKTLAVYGLEPRFYKTVTGSDITNGKPHPEIYLKAASELGFLPNQCLVLEDSSTGCRAAKNAGIFTVAVPAEHSKDQDFSFVDLIAASLADSRIKQMLI